MKNLLVMRHAKSSWGDPNIPDHDRPLSKRGVKDGPRMGESLRERGVVPDAIVTSTAKRSLDTAHAIAQSCGFAGEIIESPKLYAAPASAIRSVLRGVDDRYERVLVVCHNPGVEEFVASLVDQPVAMKTAAIAHVAVPIDAWGNLDKRVKGQLVGAWRPKDLS